MFRGLNRLLHKIKNAFRFGDKRKAPNKTFLSQAVSIIIVVKPNRVHKILKIKTAKIIQDCSAEMQPMTFERHAAS